MAIADENKTARTFPASFIMVIKAIAITGIFSWHYYSFIYNSSFALKGVLSGLEIDKIIYLPGQIFVSYGQGMAKLFIIASGFGLYLSHLNNKQTWKAFYLKRSKRVLPLYWLAVIGTYLISQGALPVEGLLYNLALLHIYTRYQLTFGSLWYVGYIFQLYLLFPLFVFLFRKQSAKWLFFASSLFIDQLLLKALSLAGLDFHGTLPTNYLPLFLFGMLLADAYYRHKTLFFIKARFVAFSWFFLLMAEYTTLNTNIFNGLFMENIRFMLIFVCLYAVYGVIVRSKILLKLSSVIAYSSFVVFLIHLPFFRKILQYLFIKGYIQVDFSGGSYVFQNPGSVAMLGFPVFILCVLLSYLIQAAYDRAISRFAYKRGV